MRRYQLKNVFSAFLLTSLMIALPSANTFSTPSSSKHVSLNRESYQVAEHQRGSRKDKVPAKSQPRSLSPYDIALFIADNQDADLSEVWKQLGIQKLNFGYDDEGEETDGPHIDRFLSRCGGCDIETFALELDGEPGREVLLKISDLLAQSCRYLLFKQMRNNNKTGWKLLGHIDHGSGKYRMPQHELIYSGGKPWLVITVQEGSGSGFSLYHDRVFAVKSTGIKEVIRFPSEGHWQTCCYNPIREFSTQVENCEISNDVITCEIQFTISYSAYLDSDEILLWEKRQKATYRTDRKTNTLVLDATKSDLTQEEIDIIYARVGINDEDFIRYNYKELSEIANEQQGRRREWLQHFIDQEGGSPEKEILRRMIKD
jgi:hypothetical protein